MRITKRNGSEEDFDPAKIIIAITKANDATEGNRLSKEQIQDVADFIQYKCQKLGRPGYGREADFVHRSF